MARILCCVPKAITTHEECFVSVVFGLDSTQMVHILPPFSPPPPIDRFTLHFSPQLAKELPHYFQVMCFIHILMKSNALLWNHWLGVDLRKVVQVLVFR